MSLVNVEVADRVARSRLNRPEAGNALNLELDDGAGRGRRGPAAAATSAP